VYASRGTVVTRALAPPPLPFTLPWPAVSEITQTLLASSASVGTMTTDNAACVSLGPLGTWRVRARGTWTPDGAGTGGTGGTTEGVSNAPSHAEALVRFAELSLEPVALGGAPLDGGLPTLRLPLPGPLAQRAARFRTLYCDRKIRIAEGAASGNRFVFERTKAGAA
jgi:hypothetical protein